jgi:hypothetical protein
VGEPRIEYVQRPEAAPEAELSALADAYLFILSSDVSKKATRPAPESDSRDGTEAKGDSANESSVHH